MDIESLIELLDMVSMYLICLRDRNRFYYYEIYDNYPHSWEDCIAAFDLIHELGKERWTLLHIYKISGEEGIKQYYSSAN